MATTKKRVYTRTSKKGKQYTVDRNNPKRFVTKDFAKDSQKKALPAGKRVSASGKTYYEYRSNHSDLPSENQKLSEIWLKKNNKEDYKKELDDLKKEYKKLNEKVKKVTAKVKKTTTKKKATSKKTKKVAKKSTKTTTKKK